MSSNETPAKETQPTSNNSLKIAAAVVIVVAIIAFVMSQSAKSQTPGTTNTPAPVAQDEKSTGTQQIPVVADTTAYKDGTYTAEGVYRAPSGQEMIDVTITLKDNVITDATVVGKAEDRISKRLQGMFIDNYKPLVIGKKITDVSLDKISGSSLTPKGFNDAITKIKAQAKA